MDDNLLRIPAFYEIIDNAFFSRSPASAQYNVEDVIQYIAWCLYFTTTCRSINYNTLENECLLFDITKDELEEEEKKNKVKEGTTIQCKQHWMYMGEQLVSKVIQYGVLYSLLSAFLIHENYFFKIYPHNLPRKLIILN